ncbi:MAG: hypothetical protein KI790_10510 [Cyclobacteriaceae bacterium]|nr:hypothetical protein [Cyclobacteriaceae bacterium HetDA_MAG_MS6]
MKYRRLTTDELEALEKEFVEYLVVNGITADEWERLKEEENDKAEQILELFSDVVFEGIMRKVQFLEYRSVREIRTFQCLPDKLIYAGLVAKEGSEVDFTQSKEINKTQDISIQTSEKPYHKERELELFEMTNQGCEISDGTWFKKIMLARVSERD